MGVYPPPILHATFAFRLNSKAFAAPAPTVFVFQISSQGSWIKPMTYARQSLSGSDQYHPLARAANSVEGPRKSTYG